MKATGSLCLLSAAHLLCSSAVEAQLPPVPSTPLRPAYYAGSEGRALESLEEFRRILEAARDTSLIAEIAVQTGELYRVSELTDDGRDLVASVDGSLLGFRAHEGAEPDSQALQVFRIGSGEPTLVAELIGSRLALWGDPAGTADYRIAYLTPGDEVAIEGARIQMERARQSQSSLEFLAARQQMAWLEVSTAELRLRDGANEMVVDLDGRTPIDWEFATDGTLLVVAALPDGQGSGLFRVGSTGTAERVDAVPGFKDNLRVAIGGAYVMMDVPPDNPAPQEPGQRRTSAAGARGVAVVNLQTGEGTVYEGGEATLSADGSTIAFLRRPEDFTPDRIRFPHGPAGEIWAVQPAGGTPRRVFSTERPLRSLALSPDGDWVAYSELTDRDWEVYVRPTQGSETPRRITNEIQHDLNAEFVGRGALLATKGESRHRRAYLYGLTGAPPLKLFDNNILRTITPEYEWLVAPSGEWVAVVAERDGDTVSPERGVYLVDLTQRVGRDELRARLDANIAREEEILDVLDARFGPIDDSVQAYTSDVSVARIHQYERSLNAFGSKYVTQPGNRRARDYIAGALRSFGYSPLIQEFEALPGVRSANVIATLPGTEDESVTYVISSHFDSSIRGPGADDNTSGTAALLEAARVLAAYPQRATIEFVFLTAEEAGLLGAREYVRQAQASGLDIAGVLNNDMVGWMNDHRLDNTIRYSSMGIRDVQHAAAMGYTGLFTYDAKYYKNTDAHAFYDVYGDIVGGIGSYPVLGNPNYHQATDQIQTVNHDLIAEVSRTTVATIMALAFGPSRPMGLTVQRLASGGLRASWSARERAVRSYHVRYRADSTAAWIETTSTAPNIELPELPDGAQVEVLSVTREGTLSWDAARVVVGLPESR